MTTNNQPKGGETLVLFMVLGLELYNLLSSKVDAEMQATLL